MSLSSGYKNILFTMTGITQGLGNRSLVLIDEPETHVHPTLIGPFMQALHCLLSESSALLLMATHSPLVIQQLPSQCVHIMRFDKEVWKEQTPEADILSASRIETPDLETFGLPQSTLTEHIYGFNMEETSVHHFVQKLMCEKGKEEAWKTCKKLGSQAKSIFHAIDSTQGGT